ncbi:VanW family protein [Psychrobacillus sp. L4]|uniref:VanW family protein n=1 Tax=Psychrobacillus sp. L4 TaxID=3236892 RepID=UPI0036F1B7FD
MKIIWKTFILFILIFILVYLWAGNFTPWLQSVKADSEISRSTIGGQEVEFLKKNEMSTLLNSKILEWKEKPILLTGNHTNLTLQPDWFTFDVESTVEQYFNELDKPWYAFWKSTPTIHIPLQFSMNPEANSLIEQQAQLNKDDTLASIISQVGVLSSGPIESVALDFSLFETERVAFDVEEIPNTSHGLKDIVSALNDQVIGSGEVFSLLEHLSDVNLGTNNEAVDFVASMVYSVLLQTNYEVVERHSQGEIPPYLEPGIEAKIHKNKDLKFMNVNNSPAKLKLTIKDSSLLVELYSIPLDTIANYQVRDSLEIKPRTIYRYSSALSPGQEELIQEGEAGLRVFVYRTISEKAGPFEKEELISRDYYPPINRVILKSSIAPEVPAISDPDLTIDMNGDGLPDLENTPLTDSSSSGVTDHPTSGEVYNELPEDSYYDKAGNIIEQSSE